MKAIIEVSRPGDYRARALEIAKRADAGAPATESDYHLGFEDAGQLFSEFTAERCRMLDVLAATGAQSIYALAKRLRRNYSNVHRDVQAMIERDIIAKDDDGRVYVPWDSVDIRVTLGSSRAA
ncbi:hypothetical protein F6R98_16160 [Candidatus Methylospira mobilis]|uniref:HTH marR-type domain-containing protein n=1 Tax=Candidatus Methylospira mobilis TaxID=1808979 RepID=A0A5Q0BJJ3_9GAMM|nr:hypothetical protein [Candidatus Methylospira mobilis]QFY43973.1 hypothetical protein F6R98_16160 [Candidatus Methylospira mobilis]